MVTFTNSTLLFQVSTLSRSSRPETRSLDRQRPGRTVGVCVRRLDRRFRGLVGNRGTTVTKTFHEKSFRNTGLTQTRLRRKLLPRNPHSVCPHPARVVTALARLRHRHSHLTPDSSPPILPRSLSNLHPLRRFLRLDPGFQHPLAGAQVVRNTETSRPPPMPGTGSWGGRTPGRTVYYPSGSL